MALIIDATPGGPAANSYLTADEAASYFASRLPLSTPWETTGTDVFLVMATRLLDRMFIERKVLKRDRDGAKYYLTSPHWTGQVATTTQRLAWPRLNMVDDFGRAIPPDVIPEALKEATAEFAGQLRLSDRTLDNDIMVQGISSVRAGSVSVAFKDAIEPWVIPNAVVNLMPGSWLTDELYTPAQRAEFSLL